MVETKAPLVNNSSRKTLLVAFAVCLVCSLIVASAAVLLKPLQVANQNAERKRVIVEIAGLMATESSIEQAYQKLNIFMVELSSGAVIETYDAKNFDIAKAVKDVNLSTPISQAIDLAQIRRKPKYLPVYRVNDTHGEIKTLILPVYGYGLWSTLHGFLALEGDLRTVQGLKFYQHAETPGLGGEVDNPQWLALWKGKIVFDDDWQPRVELIKGSVEAFTPDAQHKVDALSGATLTTRGVENLLNFWLGKEGFGTYLDRLREERN